MNPPMHAALEKIGTACAERHLFLCLGPDCCSATEGEIAWQHLKKRIKEENLPALRTKAACLRVCEQGPVMVVYPEGIWYGGMTPERMDRVVREHLVEGRPVWDWVLGQHPLPGGKAP